MARLPEPGKDSGQWGTILNDFLSQVHEADGRLKENVIHAAQIRQSAVTTSALSDGAVTPIKLQGVGDPNGIGSLDQNGRVPETQLPPRLTLPFIAAGQTAAEARQSIGAISVDELPDSNVPSTVYAATTAAIETLPTRVKRDSDLAASLTPDGRTKVVLLSGQSDQVFTAFTGGWTTGAQSSDTTRIKVGTASRRFLTPGAGTFTCRYTESKTFPAASLLQAWVWIDDPSKVTSISIRPCVNWNRTSTGPFRVGWNLIRFRASEGTLTDWGTVAYTLLTFTTTASAGINIGEVWVECPPKAQILFIEDRGYKTFKDTGLAGLRSLGIPVTWALDPAINGSNVGTPAEAITDADVAAFYAAGDDISIHSYDGAATTDMTVDEVRQDSLKALEWLHDRGYEAGRGFRAAWTQNLATNHTVAQPYFAAYASPVGSSGTIETWPVKNQFNVGRYQLHGRTDAQFDSLFDTLKRTHQIIFAYTHGIHDVQSGAITQASWNYFLSKCATGISEGWLEGVTWTQLMERSGGIVR